MSVNPKELIEAAVKEGYIEGIHMYQNKTLALRGFHKDFEMLVLNQGQIEKVDLDKWLLKVEVLKKNSPTLWQAETKYEYQLLDLTAGTASVKVVVYKGETYFSTDYLLLYLIDGTWKIVSKVYSITR